MICSALRHNNIGIAFCRFDKLKVHWFYKSVVMVENTLDRPAAFDQIATDDADEAVVGVGIYKNFDAEFIPQFGVCKNQNPLDDNHFFGSTGSVSLALAQVRYE